MQEQNLARVREIVASYDADPSNLIAILQEIQADAKYLSEESLTLVAQLLGLSAAKVLQRCDVL